MKKHHHIPPRFAEKILNQIIRPDLAEEVLGDLEEKFYATLVKRSSFRARLNYWYQVLNYLRPFAIRKRSGASHSNPIVMFSHNIKIARRSILKQKMYAAIKIGGFSIGIAACLLIALFIREELSYDKHYADGDNIYRLVGAYDEPGESWKGVTLPAIIKPLLEEGFPEIEKTGRLIIFDFFASGNNQFRPVNEMQNTYEEGFVYADPETLEILEIPMVYGYQTLALSEPNTLVISQKKADKYFPGENPVGRMIILNENESNPYKIGGVMENFPSNSHLQCDFILTLTGKEFWPGEQSDWNGYVYDSYLKLRPGSNPVDLEEKLLSIRDNHIVVDYESRGDQRAGDIKEYFSFQLQPVKDIYLRSDDILDNNVPHGDLKVVWVFGAIAVFILLLACINFINLSTAKSANRAKEVGLRKVVGSYRSGLVSQFMTESLVFSFISFIIGALLAWILLPYFNLLSGKSLVFPWSAWWLVPGFISSIVITGIMAGFYPALYLSAFKPIDVLKGKLSRGSSSSKMRGGMVIFQFTTSIVLMICTFITYQQMTFILNTKIGFDKEQVVMIQGANTLGKKRAAFKNELLQLSEVMTVTQSSYFPVSGTQRNGDSFWKEGRSKLDKGVGSQIWWVDQDYIPALGMKLVSGRNFSAEMASDSSAMIINQTMAKQLGLEDPVGERITVSWGRSWNVIGMVEDFHFESMKGDVEPLCLVFGQYSGSIVSVKVNTKDMAGTLASISRLWEEFMPAQPIRYAFLDERYARMYADVERTGKVFTAFAVLAIVVACLGLFALSAFMVEQRSKEISVRKVLGASLGSIFNLLTLNFLRLVLIAMVIAMPIGWYVMRKWLEDYANRIEITWEVFAITGIAVLLIALLTISSESIKAALINPAKKLRSE